jgi:hypothetical protein
MQKMQKIMKNFSEEIQTAVKNEKLVKIPRFPGNRCCFVTPEMEVIYRERTGHEMQGLCVVDLTLPAIMATQGSKLVGVDEGLETYQIWAQGHSDEDRAARQVSGAY